MTLKIQENVPLAPLTTFNIGGPARYFAELESEQDITDAASLAEEREVPLIILSGGSNVLVPDEGLNAFVAIISLKDCKLNGNVLEAGSGCNLLSLIRYAAQAGLGGWEKLAGIPGTICGAIRGNAGAFGTEIKDLPFACFRHTVKSVVSKMVSSSSQIQRNDFRQYDALLFGQTFNKIFR